MAASNTDKFKKAKRRFATTIGTGGFAQGATTLPLASTAGLDTDTAITLVIDPGTTNEEVVTGVVSGSNVINCVRAKEGTTDTAHAAGEVVTMYFTETHWDDMVTGILVEHNQDGTHGAITASSVSIGGVSLMNPVGTVLTYAGSSAPTGYLLCDGTAISRTTYANLYAVIGTTYGVGDNTTTFNLPDLKGRIPVGKNTGTFSTLGGTGGAETHTLTEAQIPSHYHSNSLSRQLQGTDDGNYTSAVSRGDAGTPDTLTWNTGNTGGGGSHNNLQPYLVMNYIIKT